VKTCIIAFMTHLENRRAVVDFCSQNFKQSPYPSLARLLAEGPVIRARFPLFGQVWMATSYDAVNDLLRDHQRFVLNPAAAGNRWMASIFRWLPRNLQPLATNMLLRDEPDHRRLRSLVDRAFQVRSVEALRPRLEVLAEEALDRLAAQAGSSCSADLIEHFARPFPLSVICELLGLPPEDRPNFTRWASRFSRSGNFIGIAMGLRGLSKLVSYLRKEIKRQQSSPRDGLLAALIQAEETGDRLTEDELLAMAFLLLAAGHETTLHQIACSVLTLFDHPEQLSELTGDWSIVETAVDELFRHVSFAQVAKPRYARQETEFWGQSVLRGQTLFACLASANADPSYFENPACLDLCRRPQRHVAFGAGIHFCLGATLARVETEIALRRLFTRFPNLRLAVPRSQIRYSRRPGTRGLMALPVSW
jgi:cytochrome P450